MQGKSRFTLIGLLAVIAVTANSGRSRPTVRETRRTSGNRPRHVERYRMERCGKGPELDHI